MYQSHKNLNVFIFSSGLVGISLTTCYPYDVINIELPVSSETENKITDLFLGRALSVWHLVLAHTTGTAQSHAQLSDLL